MMKPSEYFRHAQESMDDDAVDAIIEEGWLEEEQLRELHDRYCRMEGNA